MPLAKARLPAVTRRPPALHEGQLARLVIGAGQRVTRKQGIVILLTLIILYIL